MTKSAVTRQFGVGWIIYSHSLSALSYSVISHKTDEKIYFADLKKPKTQNVVIILDMMPNLLIITKKLT